MNGKILDQIISNLNSKLLDDISNEQYVKITFVGNYEKYLVVKLIAKNNCSLLIMYF